MIGSFSVILVCPHLVTLRNQGVSLLSIDLFSTLAVGTASTTEKRLAPVNDNVAAVALFKKDLRPLFASTDFAKLSRE